MYVRMTEDVSRDVNPVFHGGIFYLAEVKNKNNGNP